jgi:hypothetical protein
VRRPQQHGSPSSGVVMPGCPDAQRALLAVRVHRQRPPVRCPPVRCVSGIRPSGVQCPVSARPVSGASVRHLRPYPGCPHRSVRGARGQPPGSGQAASACHSTSFATGSSAARVQAWRLELAPAALAAAASAAGARRRHLRRVGGGLVRLFGRQGGAVARQDRRWQGAGAWEVRPPTADCTQLSRAMLPTCGRPRPGWWVARAGRPLARQLGERRGPTAAQGGRRAPLKQPDREGKPSLTWENRGVGLPGLEPRTSSLSGIEGSALSGPAFSPGHG